MSVVQQTHHTPVTLAHFWRIFDAHNPCVFTGFPCRVCDIAKEITALLSRICADNTALISAAGFILQKHAALPAQKNSPMIEIMHTLSAPPYHTILAVLQKIDTIKQLCTTHTSQPHLSSQYTKLRSLAAALSESDWRIMPIYLAYGLCILKAAACLPQQEKARLAQDVFLFHAPLAHRLNMGLLKKELENTALSYSNPTVHAMLKKKLKKKLAHYEASVQAITQILNQKLKNAGITHATISGRIKHLYSIYAKMQAKKVSLEEVYDVTALRIQVENLSDCYLCLNIVQACWEPIPKAFDDYIAKPKHNGYQSIHTALIGPDKRPMEIQIRTHKMHEFAELGVAAHWLYKEKELTPQPWPPLSTDTTSNKVHVLTPKGDIKILTKGATPLDFAYSLHTDIGHHCKGAKIHGRIISLTHTLENADQVEILTHPQSHPSRDWLNPQTGYLKTRSARAKVRAWFRPTASESPTPNPSSSVDTTTVQTANKEKIIPATSMMAKNVAVSPPSQLCINGTKGLLTRVAQCCQPLPGEYIVGYITQGRGVSVHRQDCANVSHLKTAKCNENRWVTVTWEHPLQPIYSIDICIKAFERPGLLSDISAVIRDEKWSLSHLDYSSTPSTQTVRMQCTIAVRHQTHLKQLLHQLKQIKSVITVKRRE